MYSVLENSICTFTILNNNELLVKNVNVVSACFFRVKNHYKDFNIYIDGLKKLLKFIDGNKHGYILMLFIDNNINRDVEIMQIINCSEKTVPVLFHCNDYIDGDYHVDLFGLLNNNFSYVQAGKFMTKNKKYDKSILINYIEEIDLHFNKKYIDDRRHSKMKSPFDYGVDEIFVNFVLLLEAGEYHVMSEYSIFNFFRTFKKKLLSDEKKGETDKIFDFVIGKYNNENMTVESKYEYLSKLFYSSKIITDEITYITSNFYNYVFL
jgi:hypothetical protein